MRVRSIVPIVMVVAAALFVAGCAGPTAQSASREPTPPQDPTGANRGVPGWLVEQAALVTSDTGIDLAPVPEAASWLGGGAAAYFVDRSQGREFIADTEAKRLVSYEPSGGLDAIPEIMSQPASYPGEPARDEIFSAVAEYAAKHAGKLDLSTMRVRQQRVVRGHEKRGDSIAYEIHYQRYLGGVRVREFANAYAYMPSWTWKPDYHLNAYPAKTLPAVEEPTVSMTAAIAAAREVSGMTAAKLESATLSKWGKGALQWVVVLDNSANVPTGAMGGRSAAVNVDALTGQAVVSGRS